jgi:hypothetical protein
VSSELEEIRTRINAALDITDLAQQSIRAHLEWEAREMIAHIPPDKMTALELAAVIAILHIAHARILVPPSDGRPVLRVVPSGLDATEVCETAS